MSGAASDSGNPDDSGSSWRLFNQVASVLWKPDLEEYPLGWELRKLPTDKTPSPKFWQPQHDSEFFRLYKRVEGGNPCYMITLQNPKSQALYSVCRVATPKDAQLYYDALQQALSTLITHSAYFHKESNVKSALEVVQKNPSYGPTHILVQLNLASLMKQEWSREWLALPTASDDRIYPVHIACEEARVDCVKELLAAQVSTTVTDAEGNTCMHYCARSDRSLELLQLLHRRHPAMMRDKNTQNMTPVHVACLFDSIQCLKFLVKSGAPINDACSAGFPLHLAMTTDSQQCIEYLCEAAPEQLSFTSSSQGELPIHMAKSNKTISALIEHGSSTEARNAAGQTAIHVMAERRNLTCLIRLLSCDADSNARDNNGNTALHAALSTHKGVNSWVTKTDEVAIDLVRALIVFGCDVNICSNAGVTPRHLVATSTKDAKLLRTLADVGALRCPPGTIGCTPGCAAGGDYSGEPVTPEWHEPDLTGQIKEFLHSFDHHIQRVSSGSDSGCRREHLLCMDGGGIRGLIILLCIRQLQKYLHRPINEMFDWIAGTSTGGICALGFCLGFSVAKGMGIYFRFKDEVFQGMMRPYDHVPLEKLLKDYFSETAVMTDISRPKVMITTCLGDRVPPDLFFFSNFHFPTSSLSKDLTHNGLFPPTDPPHRQLLWQVARATSAAPTFFSPFGRMLDGGLMCNNPTLDVMTEVHRMHEASRRSSSGSPRPAKLGAVVSCGTGMVPVTNKSLAVCKPTGVLDGLRSVANLVQLTATIIDQATVSEGRPVAQAQAWAHMCDTPYVRFNPPVSSDTPLNETQDSALLKFCWEAQCFINRNDRLFQRVAHYINITKSPPPANQ